MAWIYDKNGQQKCEIKRLSYTGTFMEVSRIMVTVESPEPIDFAIGDYIDWAYDGLRYKLDTAAGVEKQARKNSIGNAFIYENLVFLSPLNEANHVDFFDVVLGNPIEFLTNTEFSFYGTAWDYAKRLEANLGRIINDNWKIRIWTNGVCYDDSPATGIDTGAWESKLVDVSGIKCLEGFQQIYNLWGCAYVFSVVSGVNYVDFYDDFEQYAKTWQVGGVDKIFAYGKGNGLYKIRHTPDADHVLVTRLRAYGSSENLPANYYFNSPDYHLIGNESSELAISHLMLPASQWEKMGDKSPANAYLDSNVGLYGVREGVVLWDGSDSELGEIKPTIYGLTIQDLLNLMSSGDTYRPVEAKWPDTTQRIDKIVIGAAPTDNGAVAEAGYDYTETESIGSLSSHSFGATQVNRDIQFDDLVMWTTPSVSHLADFRIVPTSENKVAVSFDIPDTIASLIDNVTAYLIPYVGGVKVEDATFPCFVSDESIYITSGGVSYTKRYKVSLLDSTGNPIVFSTMLTGAVTFHIVGHINFRAGMEPDNSFPVVRNEYSVNFSLLRGNKAIDKFFSVTVPQIGFDLAAAVSGSSKLCMRSGANQPREFVIVPSSVRYNESTDTWYIRCKRSVDQSTKTYFPNSDAVIASGDEYYLSGIAMPSLYVEIAAQKLLEAATAWLQYHSNPRMLSSVEVDNKIMAEEGIVLKEGMALPITDADLGITTVNQESRVIDNIRIEEGTDSIRTFSITLRDKKEKSSLDAAIRGATSDFATNSSVIEAVSAAVNTGHGSLTGRDLPNQHPISSISGLEEKLSSLSFFEQYVLPGNAGVAIKLRDEYVGLFSNGWVSSGGISESGGGGGGSVNALRNWANYRPDDTTQVLGSNLGKGLKDDITTLQGYFTNGVADYADDANTLGGHASTYFAHTVRLGSTDYSASNGLINIPSITTGVISDLETWIANKGFVTKAVNDLTNYYLKSQTYTQAEVNALIAAINQFRYEIAASTSAVVNPQPNVLYLIGPVGTGSDKYEEYVYPNATTGWTKIGDTSIDLTGYVNAIDYGQIAETPVGFVSGVSKESGSGTIVFDFTNIYGWALASTKPSYTFAEIGSKPTTLAGYGISDAYINNGTIVLGANSITPLTQHQSLTGYVNAIAEAGQTDMYTCPVCGYRYDPAVGDPDSGITPGTPFADLPSDWECPICQTGKDEFELGGTQYVKAVSKPASSSTITFTEGRVSLADIDGANSLKGIAYLSGTSGILKKTGPTTWELDPNAFPTSARELTDADDLCYVDPDEGVTVIIDDPGVTGTVLWGAESANQVALSVNGVSKLLLKSAAIAGLESSISTLSGYFINGSARNALSLGGHNAAYFASASGLTALQEAVAGKQDTIVDLAAIRSGANHGETAYGWGNHASAGYATQNWVNGQLALYPYQIVVNGDAFGSVNGTIELPDYPTTLPASDVYAWAKAATKPSYTFSEIGSKPSTLAGYGITDAYISNGTITLGSNSITPLTSHQSLAGYAHQVVVNGDAFEAVDSVIELPDYPTTLPASDVYAWAKAATKPTYTATEVGLGNVTNDAQVKRTEMGAASGVATLGTDGKIPASQLPSYVDDVLEYASLSAFPATGESGKIYVALDTNKTYRWSGTTYTEISPSIVIGTTTGTAFDGGSGYAHVTDGDIHVTAALKTAWSAKYDLPSGGIPSTDLASAIQTSLGHGDTAYGWGDHALAGYFPATSFTKANIKTVLEISDWALAASKPSYNFSEIGSTPTTLGGYGITDAKIENGVITLGSNTITPLTQHQSLVGYVNAISPSAETDVYLCPDCDYFYDPAIGDPIGGIAVGTAFADLPSEWVCPICGASKEDFTQGGRQFVSGVSKSSGSSTVSFTLNRLALRDLSGSNNLKAIEYASGSGLLKKNADGTWGFDANSYLTGITSSMITTALGYTPFDSANFTQANIQSTLGISNWALAASKPSYAFSELSSHPTTLSGYGITDAAAASDLLAYLPLSGGSMTGQLVVPLLKINGPTTDYVELASLAGELYVGSGALSRLVFDTGNYTSYVYTKAQVNEKDGILASGISSNSARLDSIEDWILGVNADTVGLGLVENVALSTWAGSGNITTLGTITTGVWNGTNIAANKLAIDFDWVFVANAGVYDTEDYIHVN